MFLASSLDLSDFKSCLSVEGYMAKHRPQMCMGASMPPMEASQPPASLGEHVVLLLLSKGKWIVVFIFPVMTHIAENYIWGIL